MDGQLKRNSSESGVRSSEKRIEDDRYYFPCPLRKGHPRIAVTICHKQKCMFLISEDGKLRCGYGDQNARK